MIPARFRKPLNLRPGDRVEVELEVGGIGVTARIAASGEAQARKVRAAGSVGDGGNAPNDDRGRDRIDRGAFLIAFPRSYGGRMRLITSQLKMQFQY